MLELSRLVRFCVNAQGASPGAPAPPRHNGYSAWPPPRGLGRYYQLQVTCAGAPDPVTGYFLNIKGIDQAVRDFALPRFAAASAAEGRDGETALGTLLRGVLVDLQPALRQTVARVRLDLTPFYSLELRSKDMDHVIVRQEFEFCAAHRLHVPALSAEENQRLFGKCNHPTGHGHNYRLQVAVRAPIDPAGRVLNVEDLDAAVDQAVIEPLDHKNLNVDVPQFARVNPSVENITKVVHEMLAPAVARLGVALEEVSVWETGKTMCTYRGPG